jgi:hypothetical protein
MSEIATPDQVVVPQEEEEEEEVVEDLADEGENLNPNPTLMMTKVVISTAVEVAVEERKVSVMGE